MKTLKIKYPVWSDVKWWSKMILYRLYLFGPRTVLCVKLWRHPKLWWSVLTKLHIPQSLLPNSGTERTEMAIDHASRWYAKNGIERPPWQPARPMDLLGEGDEPL